MEPLRVQFWALSKLTKCLAQIYTLQAVRWSRIPSMNHGEPQNMAEQLSFEIAGDLQPTQTSTNTTSSIERTSCERDRLEDKYASAVRVNPRLDRTLVSFQANKQIPFYRW